MNERMKKRTCVDPLAGSEGRGGSCIRRGLLARHDGEGLFGVVLLLAVATLSLAPLPLRAQPSAHVEVRVSADSVKVGERFTVTLVAEHAADASVHFPAPSEGSVLFGDLTVLRRGKKRSRTVTDTRVIDSVAYRVAAFALDSVQVPVLPVRVGAGPDTTVVGSPPRVVPVISVVPADASRLRAPAALAHFPRPLWVWALLGGAVVLLGGGAYVWWRRGDDSSESSPQDEAAPDPYEVASARLQQLARRNPNDRESCKAFYVDLTETLRVYLARRVGVRALECTTPELVAALRHRSEVSEAATRRIQDVLERADLVKFADAQPEPAESRAVLKEARGVLDSIEAAQRRAEAQSPEEAPTAA